MASQAGLITPFLLPFARRVGQLRLCARERCTTTARRGRQSSLAGLITQTLLSFARPVGQSTYHTANNAADDELSTPKHVETVKIAKTTRPAAGARAEGSSTRHPSRLFNVCKLGSATIS